MTNHQDPRDGLSRREFVGAGAIGAALLGAGLPSALAQPDKRRVPPRTGTPRNVILMIADGMSPGVLQLGEHFSQSTRGQSSVWMDLCHSNTARTTLMSTASASGPVTDSAAAGTAFSVGARTNNGRLCVMPDGSRPTPFAQRIKASGRATGLVTTTQLAHATPASFIVNHPDRHDYEPIAVQMLAKRPDVMLGGGTKYFTPGRINTHASDATILRTRQDLLKGLPDDGAVMGFFTPGHMSYELDRRAESADTEPSLAEMTDAALQRLAKDDSGFFLMVEGGRVDHAAHANDILGLLHDQLAFDDALGVARVFAENRSDTLLITTSDHGNANPAITHYSSKGKRGFEHLANGGGGTSFERMYDQFGSDATVADVAAVLERERKIELTRHDHESLERVLTGKTMDAFKDSDSLTCVLGSVLANHYSVAFCSPNHTSDHVVLTTTGPMFDRAPVLGHITDLHAFMASALRLS